MFTRRRMLRAGTVLLLLLLMGALALGAAPRELLVTVDLRQAKVPDALRMVLRDSKDSLVIAPGALQGQEVSINLKGVPVSTAMRLVCNAAGVVGVRSKEGIWQVTAPQAMIQVNNQQVPILGAVQVGSNQVGPLSIPPEVLQQLPADASLSLLSPPPATERHQLQAPIPPPLGGSDVVSLQVDNAPLRDAVARLDAASGQDVVVWKGVPEKLRVTAHVYLMPFTQFLGELAQQADLAVQWQAVNAEGKPAGPSSAQRPRVRPGQAVPPEGLHYRYYLVPFPVFTIIKGGEATRLPEGPLPAWEEGDLTDLAVTDVPLREAIAKTTAASGLDIVVDPAVPATIRVTAAAYRVPASWLLNVLTGNAGLELREQIVDQEGKPVPSSLVNASSGPELPPENGYHTRYYVVPKSELKVTGSAGQVLPRALAGSPESQFKEFIVPNRGPVQLDPSHFVIGLLSSDPMDRQQARLVR